MTDTERCDLVLSRFLERFPDLADCITIDRAPRDGVASLEIRAPFASGACDFRLMVHAGDVIVGIDGLHTHFDAWDYESEEGRLEDALGYSGEVFEDRIVAWIDESATDPSFRVLRSEPMDEHVDPNLSVVSFRGTRDRCPGPEPR